MAVEKQFHVGIKALITNDKGQVLLLKENVHGHNLERGHYWDFPGGRMEDGETVVDTLRREVEEETGIKEISEPEFKAATISPVQIKLKNGEVVGLVLMVYKTTIPKDSVIRLEDTQIGYEWVDIKEAKKRITHKYPKDFIDQL